MKKLLLITFLVITIGVRSQITIPNASFENWTTGTFFNPDVPAGWKSYSVSSGATKTTDAHTGTYALKLKIKLNSSVPDISAGFTFPTTNAPIYFSYWAKIHLNGSDKFYINADIYNKTTNSSPASIPYAEEYTYPSQNTAVWTLFTYTLQGNFTTPSDSAHLRFTYTTGVDTASYVIIDDLAFSNAPAGISELSDNGVIESAFPNPANTGTTLLYRINEPAKVSLTLYDILGKGYTIIENEHQQQGSYKVDIDVRDYATGVYYLHLYVNGQQYVRKIVVSR